VILKQTSNEAISLNLPDLVLHSPLQKSWSKESILRTLNQRNQPNGSNSSKQHALKELLSSQEEGAEQSILDLAVLVFLHLMLEIYGDKLR